MTAYYYYDDLTFAGPLLLDTLQVSVLHLVHVLFGVAGLAMAPSWSGARTFLLGIVIYLGPRVQGLVAPTRPEVPTSCR